ncbi:MAG: AraC family transcriptional regulator [Ruminococcaceae bacterium]|nr:AraC family transcriptional regulator [Oscillospiraceae bacterium]
MTVNAVCEALGLKVLNIANGEREIDGVYAGDLLSWVMGHAKSSQALVTIMSNINVLAVASLLDLSCVILAEEAEYDGGFIEAAKSKEINVFSSPLSAYELCVKLSGMI